MMRAGLARHLDLKPPFERGALEHERLLRQPEQPRAAARA